jgi:hypothetical protein
MNATVSASTCIEQQQQATSLKYLTFAFSKKRSKLFQKATREKRPRLNFFYSLTSWGIREFNLIIFGCDVTVWYDHDMYVSLVG